MKPAPPVTRSNFAVCPTTALSRTQVQANLMAAKAGKFNPQRRRSEGQFDLRKCRTSGSKICGTPIPEETNLIRVLCRANGLEALPQCCQNERLSDPRKIHCDPMGTSRC